MRISRIKSAFEVKTMMKRTWVRKILAPTYSTDEKQMRSAVSPCFITSQN